MSIISWILLGLVAGFLANTIDPRPASGGLLGTIVLGIIGAIVGGFLGQMVLGIGISGFDLTSIFIAMVGSLVILFLARTFRRT